MLYQHFLLPQQELFVLYAIATSSTLALMCSDVMEYKIVSLDGAVWCCAGQGHFLPGYSAVPLGQGEWLRVIIIATNL